MDFTVEAGKSFRAEGGGGLASDNVRALRVDDRGNSLLHQRWIEPLVQWLGAGSGLAKRFLMESHSIYQGQKAACGLAATEDCTNCATIRLRPTVRTRVLRTTSEYGLEDRNGDVWLVCFLGGGLNASREIALSTFRGCLSPSTSCCTRLPKAWTEVFGCDGGGLVRKQGEKLTLYARKKG